MSDHRPMTPTPRPTVEEIMAAIELAKKQGREYQTRQEEHARLICCPAGLCMPSAVWMKNTLWLCPHNIEIVKSLPREDTVLPISESLCVGLYGLRIGEIESLEFLDAAIDAAMKEETDG